MKKIVSSVIITCMLLMSFCNICYAATFQPTITTESGAVGDTINVTVSIPANTNAAGGSFNLVYDNTKMELVDATAGDIISAFSKTVNKTYAANKVRLNFAGSETVSESGGVVLNATFRLTASGTATFSTEKFKLADIDTNYLTCADSTQNISIASGDTSSVFIPTITAENGTVGDTINVTVAIPANTNAAGGSFNLVYDNTKMELVDATTGDIISAFSKTVNKTYAANKVRLNFAGSETVSASGGIVLNASFKLTASGTATISTEKFKLADIDTNYLTCENTSKSITITEPSTTVAVTGVSLNKTSTTLTVGGTETLTATVAPINATNKNVSWTSSNTSVASVSNGVITAKTSGTTIITVTTADGNKKATCTVTVIDNSEPDIPVIPSVKPTVTVGSATGEKGETVKIPVVLENNSGFSNLALEIKYDDTALELVSVSANSEIGADLTTQYFTINPYNLIWESENNIEFNGTLVTFTFEVIASKSGTYPITVDYYKGRNGNNVDGKDVNYDENSKALGLSYVSGSVTVSKSVAGGSMTVSGISFSVSLDGDTSIGTVYASIYDSNGKLNAIKQYPAADIVNVEFDAGVTGAYVKIMWWNEMMPMCEAQTIPLK